MDERKILKKNSTLLLRENDSSNKRKFTITKRISESGGSVICYEAYHKKSIRGILKEFYPEDAYALERTAEGQLIHTEEWGAARKRFESQKEAYLQPYEMLLLEKRRDASGELATFIPPFQIYHGCDEEGNLIGSAYIWSEEPEYVTFGSICEEIHKEPDREPEHKLVQVLTAMEALAKCLCALHQAGLIHRDIKPANFGFKKRHNEILMQTLQIFDINSICSVYNPLDTFVIGSRGYIEPEAEYKTVNNQADIYSVGATLFHAIIVTDAMKEKGYLYEDTFYNSLQDLVDESELIRASEANSHPRLRNILTEILKKCLAGRRNRYQDCEELLEDLEIALYYALPSEIARKKLPGEQWVLKDIEKSLDVNSEKNSRLAIQYHLYRNPIYRWAKNEGKPWKLLLLGFGNYGQRFLDVCLQTTQLPGATPDVMVVSNDATDREIYLGRRPALDKFFNVSGSLTEETDSYGTIDFQVSSLSEDNKEKNKRFLRRLFCSNGKEKVKEAPQYIFIALGNDELNRNVAQTCKEAAESLQIRCCVNYVVEEKKRFDRKEQKEIEGIFPVYVSKNVQELPLYKEIERMAFNTHLVWEKGLNLNYSAVRKEFRKPYNYDSCISYVLALKYKLYSVGIDLDTCDYGAAAGAYTSQMQRQQNLKNLLIWAEHKRWGVEKICDGWTQLTDLKECLEIGTKDEKRKTHVCIVRSRPEQLLTTIDCDRRHYEKWDTANEKELEQLDELDRMSVELHRVYAKKAAEVKKQNLLNGNNMAELQRLVTNYRGAFVSFQEWRSCLKEIWNGDRSKVRLYKGLKESLAASLNKLPKEIQDVAKVQLKALETLFRPLLASMEYRDYKQDDLALVENIPFILTYSTDICLVVPYQVGDNTDLFSNVASATVIGPARILYLCYLQEKQDIREIKAGLAYIAKYMEKKKFRTAVEFVIVYSDKAAGSVDSGIEYEFRKKSAGRVRKVTLFPVAGDRNMTEALFEYLKRRKKNKRLFLVENNSTLISGQLRKAGLADEFDTYTFSSKNMEFETDKAAKALSYIRKMPYIRVSDMLAITMSSSGSSNQPEFYADYKEFWKKYRENSSSWKQLCRILGNYASRKDVLAVFGKKTKKAEKPTERRYIIPFMCYSCAVRIMKYLKEHKIAESDSRINVYTSDSCEVVIADCYEQKELYDRLFSNLYALMEPDAIRIYETPQGKVKVQFDNLKVECVSLEGNQALEALLRYFEKKGCIINLQKKNDEVSFTFATRKIKELLTTEGKMLEIYTYHKIKETGAFDDVVSSYEIDWENMQCKNGFDCIVTKGFCSLFIECKERRDAKQEFQFGINAKTVRIADMEEECRKGTEKNDNSIQCMRSNKMEVITIWKTNEIENIGDTLISVIEDRYKERE